MKTMRNFLVLALTCCLSLLGGCKKNEPLVYIEDPLTGGKEVLYSQYKCPVKGVTGPADGITGKWKLVKEEGMISANVPFKKDYSCDQIIYHFRTDGSLTIINDRDAAGLREGVFEFIHREGDQYTLRIRPGRDWVCRIQDQGSTMTLNGMAFDGGLYYFVRTM